jgi:DNA-binding transcriptional ArsR family regulator
MTFRVDGIAKRRRFVPGLNVLPCGDPDYAAAMIRVRMTMGDLQRTLFGHSPLLEVAESLWMLSSGRIQPVHRRWYDDVRDRLKHVDLELLDAVVPGTVPKLASFLLPSVGNGTVTIEQQLSAVAGLPAERLSRELHALWQEKLPKVARQLIADGDAGPRRIADAMWRYWTVAIAPHWLEIRAVLDEDIAYRAAVLTRKGAGAMFDGLHHKIRLHDGNLHLEMPVANDRVLVGDGIRLVPSVFSWPYIVFDVNAESPPSLVYPARGVGELWSTAEQETDEDALGALLGRNRAAILLALAVPQSTTKLALALGQSAPAVSQHLSVLRRGGLVASWRSGRFVFYQRTNLGSSIVEASRQPLEHGPPEPGTARSRR